MSASLCITKAVPADHALRVHLKFTNTKTLCGIVLTPAQEDLAECNCQRCLKIRVRKPRAYKRLNGRRVSPKQTVLLQ
jgi:hypothetical protein